MMETSIIQEFALFINEVNKYTEGVHFLNPGAELSVIEGFEKSNNISLPKQYKNFLRLHNGGELFRPGVVLAAIYNGKTGDKKIGVPYLDESLSRHRRLPGMPNNLLIIADMNYGDPICIALNHSDDESKVVQWSIEDGNISREWDSFTEWLSNTIEEGSMLVSYDGSEKELDFL
ncbi:MAG: SMI1/KNR4 family protein [Peptococcaceae bacterium]|jgi:hypothetical protein|nr:SMI1/KNR4 family protein [Peptococcaceae bacterium]